MDNNDVLSLAAELAHAVDIIMSPTTSQPSRMEAYVACEKFKEASPLCAQAGLYLASGPFNNAVRHFGLQLMEHTVKFKWNDISQAEKLFIKEHAMKLLGSGVGPAEDPSLSHIKDALSRVIVEMAKREWPQQWTTFLGELSAASEAGGPAPTELVLLVFLRLVEDVALLQTIESNQRRKDIYQALTVNMTEIFAFFLRLIELHVGAFRRGAEPSPAAHSRVVQMVLLTLTGFVDWVSIVHIMAGDGRMLQILCVLLDDRQFQNAAADCLSQIVFRKGQMKDRKPLGVLFSEQAMAYVVRAAETPAPGSTAEHRYGFLRRLLQVLTGMGTQIVALWGRTTADEPVVRPDELRQFLGMVFALTQHPSLTLAHGACLIWNALLKHETLGRDPVLLECIPRLIGAIGPRVVKIPYPVRRSCQLTDAPEGYICTDYDSEEEYTIFFHRSRTTILEIVRHATLVAPLVTFAYCEQWLRARLAKAPAERGATSCRVQDAVYIEWEALIGVLDSVLSRILMVSERPSVQTGLQFLEQTLAVDYPDPLIMSIVLSCISTLFVFLSMSSCQLTAGNCVAMSGVSLLPRVLEKIFAAFGPTTTTTTAAGGGGDRRMAVAERNLRRHSAALMVKLGIKYPLLLLPVFDQIHQTVQQMERGERLRRNETATLQEALLVISNHFCDYERQSTFVGEVLRSAAAEWHQLSAQLKTGADFVRFAGLDGPAMPANDDDDDETSPAAAVSVDDRGKDRRNRLRNAINAVLGVVRRCSWPDDPDRAARGGFVVGQTESGNPVYRNPAAVHVVPLLPHILSLLRVQNELFGPDAMRALHPAFRCVYAMCEPDKKTLMGISPVLFDPMDPEQRRPTGHAEAVQAQLSLLFDNCYHLMGSAGPSLGRDLYHLQGIAEALIGSVFAGLQHVPDYRVRPIVRVFLKPFVYSCPPAFYEAVLLPVWAHLAPLLLQRLTQKWTYIAALYEAGELGDDVTDTQEVLEDMLNRTLTREYLDVMKVALVGGQPTDAAPSAGMVSAVSASDVNGGGGGAAGPNGAGGAMMEHMDDNSCDSPHNVTRASQSAMAAEVISELGAKLLRCPATCTPMVLTVLSAIHWKDSASSLKAVLLTGPIVRFMAAENLLSESIASNVLIAVLQGLQSHGHHESNQTTLITLGVQVYEILRPKFPVVVNILQQIPNTQYADIQRLDEKIAVCATKGNKIDKAKKDLFKKITGPLIGKTLGELFRKEIQIVNLAPMPARHANSTSTNIVDSNQPVGITQLFSTNS